MSTATTLPRSAATPRANRLSSRNLFLILVAAPTVLAAIYYGLIAAPIYVSEARFIVRSPTQPAMTGVGALLQGAGLGGFAGGDGNVYAVHAYIMSRDAVADLEQHHDLRAILARPKLDFLARFPRPFQRANFEDLYREYPRFVSVGNDPLTGISDLKVEAFRPQDAHALAVALLDGGERVVNRLNDRAAADAVADARRQVGESEDRVAAAEGALTGFRNRERLIDPSKSGLAGMEVTGKLQLQLDTLKADRAALAASAAASPQLAVMDRQIHAFEGQLAAEQAKMAGDNSSLAPKIGQYERLTLEREFSAKELTEASTALALAREEARRKRLYLERVVPPNTPDTALLPKRVYSIAMVFITTLLIWATVVLVIAGLKEHGQADL
ncbi:MAG TPA: chain-length determining protein [Caulobacteraceae bacterium]|jgi:BexC/CtrB/KpsE family polysaccharide export inner-membrane protein|nr:chain-length determining protein [Caulobacteraceae bacterium]